MSAKGLHHSLCQDAPDSAVEPGAWPWLVEKSSAGEAKGQRQAYQAASQHAMTFSVPDPEAQKGWIEEARHQFPAGLHQPEGSFRFSMDALLLARHTAKKILIIEFILDMSFPSDSLKNLHLKMP